MTRPNCPDCQTPMTKRRIRKTGGYFWGCTNYFKTKCKGFLNYNGEDGVSTKPAKSFTPSKYQEAIYDWIKDKAEVRGRTNLVIEAVAGSGKTSSLLEALQFIPEDDKAVFCAFNKHIANELGGRAPNHVKVATIHSLGFHAICQSFDKKPTVDDKKVSNIINELFDRDNIPNKDRIILYDVLRRIVSLVKATLSPPTNVKRMEELCDRYGIETNGSFNQAFPYINEIIKKCRAYKSVIDFDDMIYLPIKLKLKIEKYDWVFVDEAQDLNACQMRMIKRMVNKTGRIICVGDRFQSIYGFRGADTEAIPKLIETLKAEQLPLSICYRCGKEIVKYAQQIVPHIEWYDDAPLGEVLDMGLDKVIQEAVTEDMLLCRINAPLVPVAYKFIKAGKKVVIRGRDIGKGIINLIEKLGGSTIEELLVKVQEYEDRECQKLMRANKSTEAIEDKCKTLVALTEDIHSITELKAKIEDIFSDDIQGIVLSSIHRSKGLESDNVYILKPELIPFPKATTPEQLQQEKNLEYVMVTRAKKRLIFVRG